MLTAIRFKTNSFTFPHQLKNSLYRSKKFSLNRFNCLTYKPNNKFTFVQTAWLSFQLRLLFKIYTDLAHKKVPTPIKKIVSKPF